MSYTDDSDNLIRFKSDKKGNYFYCLNCDRKVYEDDVEETDKWWDTDGNHRMIYTCPYCGYENYE